MEFSNLIATTKFYNLEGALEALYFVAEILIFAAIQTLHVRIYL